MIKILLILVWLMLLTGIAEAQKTCARTTSTSQNCLVTLSWTASVIGAGQTAPTQYVVRRKDASGPITEIGTVTATITTYQNTFTDAGNIPHCWDAIARHIASDGTKTDSSPSNQACWQSPSIVTAAPAAPSGFTISAISNSTLALSWDDTATEDGYEIWGRSAKGSGKQFAMVGTAPQDATNWEWINLPARATYCARMRAKNGAGASAYTALNCVTTLK